MDDRCRSYVLVDRIRPDTVDALLRRRATAAGPVDEAFSRRGDWVPTTLFIDNEGGHGYDEITPVSVEQAAEVEQRFRREDEASGLQLPVDGRQP